MLEFHCIIGGEDNRRSDPFFNHWLADRCKRETVVDDACTIYIDQYVDTPHFGDAYTTENELFIVFDGVLHDLTPEFKQQADDSFSTATTYDIITAAYKMFDWSFPQHLIGDYRFLLFDRSQRRLLVGRDKTTYDPVYVTSDGDAGAVSTDLAALVSEMETSVNETYLGQFLTGTIEPQHQTFYSEISRIPPGCVAIMSETAMEIQRYYHPSTDKRAAYQQMTEVELGALLREKLETALNCRVPATESTGIFMSGGADSTALAGLVASSENDTPLQTYSYTFPNTTAINEVDGIDAAIDTYAIRNERVSLDDYWILKDKAIYEHAWTAAPPVDPLLQPKAELLERAARDGKETILVGDKGNMFDGHRLSIADALRAGTYWEALTTAYDDPVYTTGAALVRYGIAPLLHIGATDGMPPKRVQEPVRSRLMEPLRTVIEAYRQAPRHHEALQDFSDQLTYRLLTSPIFDYRFDVFRKLAKSHGIRVVDPYQDSRLVEFVLNLPPTSNLCGGNDKALFRRALQDTLPSYILSRRKTDRVEEEAAEGLRRERSYVASLLEHGYLKELGVIQEQYDPEIAGMIDRFGDIDTGNTHLWEYLSAQAWLDARATTLF